MEINLEKIELILSEIFEKHELQLADCRKYEDGTGFNVPLTIKVSHKWLARQIAGRIAIKATS